MVEKKKSKPDYTKFMKKPAPLEQVEPPAGESSDFKPAIPLEDEIPLAEILPTQEENGSEELADIRYFETVSEEEHHSSEQSQDMELIPAPDFYDVTDKRSPEQRSKIVSPESPRKSHPTDDAENIGILLQQLCAFLPPPVPVFIAPILLALLFLAF